MISLNTEHIRNGYINISLATIYLSAPSLILAEIATELSVSLSIINGLIFVNIIFLFMKYYGSCYFPKPSKIIIRYFSIIFIYFIVLLLFSWGLNFDSNTPRGFIRVLITLFFVIGIVHSNYFNVDSFLKSFIYIAATLSLLATILFFGFIFGFMEVYTEAIQGHHPVPQGFGGYLGTVGLRYTTQVGIQIRAQSYFTEPSNFAQFLQIPMFTSIWYFNHKKNIKSFILMIIIIVGFLLTFSIANYFGVFFGILIYSLVKIKRIYNQSFLIKSLIGLLIISGIYLFIELNSQVNQKEYKTVLAKGDNEALPERLGRNRMILNDIKSNPLGFSENKYNFNPGLIGYVLTVGGIPLFIITVLLLYRFYLTLFINLKNGKYSIIYIGAFSYLAPFFWDGQLHEYFYLFFIILLTLITSKEKNYIKNF